MHIFKPLVNGINTCCKLMFVYDYSNIIDTFLASVSNFFTILDKNEIMRFFT
jgi:hypothetical protein